MFIPAYRKSKLRWTFTRIIKHTDNKESHGAYLLFRIQYIQIIFNFRKMYTWKVRQAIAHCHFTFVFLFSTIFYRNWNILTYGGGGDLKHYLLACAKSLIYNAVVVFGRCLSDLFIFVYCINKCSNALYLSST